MVCKKLLVFVLFIFCLVSNVWAIDVNNSDVPIGEECGCRWWDSILPTECNAAFNAGKWSPAKWGFESSSSSKYWFPYILYAQNYLFDNLDLKCYFLPNKI